MDQQRTELLERVVELAESGRADALRTLLAEQRSSDIAEVVELLDADGKRMVFDLLARSVSAEVLEKVDEATRARLFDILEDDELIGLIAELEPADAADLLAELPKEESRELLEQISSELATRIKDLMVYSEDSAGGIMDPSVIAVHEEATVGQAIERIRQAELDEDFYAVFVTNKVGQYLGNVPICALITKPAKTPIKDLIETDTIYVRVDTDQEEVRNLFKKNDLIVVPVVDEEHKLVGRITADRVIEVAEEEAAEDMYTMAGTDPSELESYSVVRAARVRMTWLLPCLIGTAVTAAVMIVFKNVFHASVTLRPIHGLVVAFVPMIAAISGNAGLQTSAIVICGLATGDLAAQRLRQVFVREVRIAALVALSCGVLGAMICTALIHSDFLAATATGSAAAPGQMRVPVGFGLAMFTAIMVASTLGLSLPFLFRRIGIDPAISSGPLVTTANDSISVTIYLSLTLLLIR
ncbi:MAG TPA: magnesium transporter [Phycisphaerales bacterium]|nr:magnesium transporter [Phycisphaerales bacterium]